MREIVINDKGQAVAPQSQPITKQDFYLITKQEYIG